MSTSTSTSTTTTPLTTQDVLEFFQSGLTEIEDPIIPASSNSSSSSNHLLPMQTASSSHLQSVLYHEPRLLGTPSSLSSLTTLNASAEHTTLQEFQQFWQDDAATADQDLQDFSAFVGDVFDDDLYATPTAVAVATPARALSSVTPQNVSVDSMLGQVSTALQNLNSQTQRAAFFYQQDELNRSLTYESLVPGRKSKGSATRINNNSNSSRCLTAQINPSVSAWLSHQLEQQATASTITNTTVTTSNAQLVTPREIPSMRDSTPITVGVPSTPESTQVASTSPSSSSSGRFGLVQTKKWDDKYQELIHFRQVHGHVLIPLEYKENPQLAHWVKRQRAQYKQLVNNKRSAMTTDRIQLLEDAGFVWDSHRAGWEGRWSELQQFRNINGHANVLIGDNQELSVWMKCQRRQYKLFCDGKPSSMTTERVQQLNSLGVVWSPRAQSK